MLCINQKEISKGTGVQCMTSVGDVVQNVAQRQGFRDRDGDTVNKKGSPFKFFLTYLPVA